MTDGKVVTTTTGLARTIEVRDPDAYPARDRGGRPPFVEDEDRADGLEGLPVGVVGC